MPVAPADPCSAPGCRLLKPCPDHGQRPNEDVRRWYRIARWRHPVWGRRAVQLRQDPLCRDCRDAGRVEPATDVDHVIPHRGDPVLFWDPSNLQSLCSHHHGQKTGRGA